MQALPEHNRLEQEKVATEQLKKQVKSMSIPRGITVGCEDNGCDNPMCKAAVQIQQELPMLDFNAARDIAIQERDLRDLQAKIKVQQQQHHSKQHTPGLLL